MAKIKRVLRKLTLNGVASFDDQLWPVNVALLVLGSFLVGIVIAYLRFDDPRWYANAWTSLVLIPLVIGAAMFALRFVNNRVLRRAVQFSAVMSLLIHVLLILIGLRAKLFSDPQADPRIAKQLVPPTKRVVIPQYQKHHLVDPSKRPKLEFEKPIETPTPEAEPEKKVEKQETKPEPKEKPEEPKSAPSPEPQKTEQPNIVKRNAPTESQPRQSDQQSKLSRQITKNTPRPNQAVDSPEITKPSESPTPKIDSQASSVSRQSPTAQPEVKTTVTAPSTNTPQPTVQLSRKDPEPTPQPDTTAKPQLTRQVNQPAVVPKSQVQPADTPAVTQRTEQNQLAPRTTATTKQETTTSPQVAQKTTEPTPDSPQKTDAKPERRQQEAEARPTVAQTPTPVPNQRTRSTTRPDPATVANAATPTPTPSANPATKLEASQSAVQRTTTAAVTDRSAPTAEPTPTPTQQPVATVQRQSTQASPTAQPSATAAPSLAKQTITPNVAPTATAEAAQPNAVARQTQTNNVAAAAVATRKQATDSPQVAKSSGEPSPASGPKANVPLPSTTASKQPSQQVGPQVGAVANAVPGKKSSATTSNVVTSVADVATNAAPTQSADFNPQPSAAQVARQANAPAASATRTQTPLDAPQVGQSNQIAQGSVQKSQSVSLPGLLVPTGSQTAMARAARSAAVAVSPANVESPALAAAQQGQGDTSAQPARMALSKSLAGVAGAGRSANLDRSAPSADSPALVASGSAQRARATQNTPDGAAMTPSAAAQISRSVAGADRPNSTIKAEQVEIATTGGTQVASEFNASSSAAVTQANANAAKGEITAAKGTIEVDLGPTQVVAENGTGRAAGGGQPELNFEQGSQQIARTKAGGAPLQAVASAAVAAVPQAPSGGQSGSTPAVDINSIATATVRSEAGGNTPISGGPSLAEKGAPTEVNAAPLLADAPISRADNATAQAGGGAGGQPDVTDESEEEKARRLARSAGGGAPQLALTAPVVAEAPSSAPTGGGAPEAMLAANTVAAATARANLGNDLPSGSAGPATTAANAGEVSGGGGELVAQATVTRAEAVDAAAGAPVAGGGTASPTRAAAGSAFVANTQAAEVSLASAPASGGAAAGTPFEASGTVAAKLTGGAPGAATKGPVGAAAGEVVVDAPASGQVAGTAVGVRQSSAGVADSPNVTASTNAGAPLRRSEQTGAAGGVVSENVVDIPQVAAILAQADDDHLGGAMTKGSVTRRASGGLSIELALADGPGGLGHQLASDVGITRRPASPDSVNVQLQEARFVRQAVGGLPSVSTAAIVTNEMFKRRIDRAEGKKDAGGSGLEPQTEDAIELGLSYLARNQSPDGRWTLRSGDEPVALSSDTAATGLSTLAFLGAGYHHREFKFKESVRTALDFLIKNQKPDGDLFLPLDDESNRSVRLYSHAIATMALCEAYLCTHDEDLKGPAQKAIDFIVASQHKEQGGWRYTPGVSADTSVTGWMVVALKYGQDAGLTIPPTAFKKVQSWVEASQASSAEKHLYRYNPYAPDTETQRHGRAPTKTMTAVGLVMRIYLGEKAAAPDLLRGADYLLENLPSLGSLRESERDTYYWYYATLFMHYMSGERWEQWNKALHPLIVNTQLKDGPMAGSWDPKNPIPDRWALHAGRLYVTTMNLLSLEVRWRGLRQSDNIGKTVPK